MREKRKSTVNCAGQVGASRNELRRNLVSARAELGLSQTELAKRAGLSRPILSMLEQGRGNPTLAILDRLSATIGHTTAELLASRPRNHQSKNAGKRRAKGVSRFSRSGRKPSLSNWLSNPPPGSKTADARDFGVDLSLIAANLRLTPTERLGRLSRFSTSLEALRRAVAVEKQRNKR